MLRVPSRMVLGALALLVPLILVNAVAIYGQVGWAQENLGGDLRVALVFACALESIGVYLAWEAHAALMAGDSSGKLRVSSYAVAVLVGSLNYDHWAGAGLAPTPAALAFGAMSTISPWLWAVRSRSLRREQLRELGLIEPRAVKFSTARWLLHFRRTWPAFRLAVWEGTVDPAVAVARFESSKRVQPDVAEVQRVPLESTVETPPVDNVVTSDRLGGPPGESSTKTPSRKAEVVAELARQIRADADWAPDYKALMGDHSISRTTAEGWVRAARQKAAERPALATVREQMGG